MFSDVIYEWLNNALDCGISEFDFWNMTFAEINRAIESHNRLHIIEEKRKATCDYILADLIGRSVSRIYNSANKLPALYEAYPSLFEKEVEEERIQKQKDAMSAARFRQFAQLTNKRFKEGELKNNE